MDGKKFYEFLKENDKTSAEAVRQAENQTKVKAEKVAEIKALESEIQTLQSTLSKNDDRLKELHIYIGFLDSLAPPAWVAAKQKRLAGGGGFGGGVSEGDGVGAEGEAGPAAEDGDAGDGGEAVNANSPFFTTPQQLLKVFSELEGHNLSLITNGQEVEESLQDLEDRIKEEQAQVSISTWSPGTRTPLVRLPGLLRHPRRSRRGQSPPPQPPSQLAVSLAHATLSPTAALAYRTLTSP